MKIIKPICMFTIVLSVSIGANVFAHSDEKHQSKKVTKTLVKVVENKNENEQVSAASLEQVSPADTITHFHQALKAGDQAKARALLADEVTIFEGGRVENSADEYANHHMLADMKYLKNITSEVLEQNLIIINDLAYSSAKTKSSGKYQGKNIERTGLETMVLKRVTKQWKIIHIHWSN